MIGTSYQSCWLAEACKILLLLLLSLFCPVWLRSRRQTSTTSASGTIKSERKCMAVAFMILKARDTNPFQIYPEGCYFADKHTVYEFLGSSPSTHAVQTYILKWYSLLASAIQQQLDRLAAEPSPTINMLGVTTTQKCKSLSVHLLSSLKSGVLPSH